MPDIHDLTLIMNTDVPIIVIESHDEKRVLEVIARIAMKRHLGIASWTVTKGLSRMGFGEEVDVAENTHDPETGLRYIHTKGTGGLYVLCDIHPYLAEPKIVRLIKDIALEADVKKQTLFLLSHTVNVPSELQRFTAKFTIRLPTDDQLMIVVREEALEWSKANNNAQVKTNTDILRKIVANLRGLSFPEARRLVRKVIFDDGAISDSDLPEINKAKFELLDMQSVLSYEYDTAKFSDVGGLSKLKEWLNSRKESFFHQQNGELLDPPKGILLLGVQGGGKSLAAKAVAGLWGLPLLRMDVGGLYNKYVGESERNLREALKLSEMMSPCVLWLDEIEKGFAVDSDDTGTSQRLLGSFLTWMAERKKPVFMVATANDVTQLPPELIRKGRLDEIFFIDLPNLAVRQQIFTIHLQKRGLVPTDFDLNALATATATATATEGFSGAEIEQAIVSALYTNGTSKSGFATGQILAEIYNTRPLSVVMAEKISALRSWASERTVSAD